MNRENLTHYKPDDKDWEKFKRISSLSEEEQDKQCLRYNDCSICPLAIHQVLLSTTKHTCVQGMTEEQFKIAMDNADVSF